MTSGRPLRFVGGPGVSTTGPTSEPPAGVIGGDGDQRRHHADRLKAKTEHPRQAHGSRPEDEHKDIVAGASRVDQLDEAVEVLDREAPRGGAPDRVGLAPGYSDSLGRPSLAKVMAIGSWPRW